jgi:S1-C subfamily serine protease
MASLRKVAVFSLLAVFDAVILLASTGPDGPDDNSSLTAALCPIVYQLDQSASARGYHYSFFGNAFFINEHGYLLTVAHVLDTFRDGGQPYILVNRPESPPLLLQVTVVAVDSPHDVAILRATPNPFAGKFRVAFMPLASYAAVPGQFVLALSLHPARPENAQSFQSPVEDRSPGEVLSYESAQLDKSAAAAQVFLLSHPVTPGQSGSPVLSLDSHAVLGLVEGRWLHSNAVSIARFMGVTSCVPGAAIPIHYAISLLQDKGISWHAVQMPSSVAAKP